MKLMPGVERAVDDRDAVVVVGVAPGAEHHRAEAERARPGRRSWPSGRWFIRATLARCSRAWRASVISVTTDAARSSSSWTWWLLQWRGWLSITHRVPRALPVAVDQRDAGVGDDAHVADGGVVVHDRMLARVVDDQSLAAGDGVLAEGVRQRRPRRDAHGSGSPRQLLKNWRSASTSETSATGALRTWAASRAMRSKAGSTSESSSPVDWSAPSRSGSRAAAAASSSACRRSTPFGTASPAGAACVRGRGPPRSRDRPAGPSRRRRA